MTPKQDRKLLELLERIAVAVERIDVDIDNLSR